MSATQEAEPRWKINAKIWMREHAYTRRVCLILLTPLWVFFWLCYMASYAWHVGEEILCEVREMW